MENKPRLVLYVIIGLCACIATAQLVLPMKLKPKYLLDRQVSSPLFLCKDGSYGYDRADRCQSQGGLSRVLSQEDVDALK